MIYVKKDLLYNKILKKESHHIEYESLKLALSFYFSLPKKNFK